MKNILLAGILGIWATAAMSHSPLNSTTPANEATVAQVPTEVLFDFKGDIRLTRVTMTHADHDGVNLDLSGNSGFISSYAVPLQSMGNGAYIIDWRGLGSDGHPMSGSFNFTVK